MEYGNEQEDKWFKWKGAKPPERRSHNIREDEIDGLLAENLKDHVCDWKQNGAEIYCDVGKYEHGKRIGTRVRLSHTDEKGAPVLVPVGAILRKDVQGD